VDLKSKRVNIFIKKTTSWKFNLFLFFKLPMAFIARLRVKEISSNHAVVSVPFNFWNKNPFQSIYFAVLSMAGELSTGLLGLMHINKTNKKISMLVINMESKFYKKAITKINFICKNGQDISNAIDQSIQTGKGQVVIVNSKGYDMNGICVAEFNITWSFKEKK